MNYELNHLSKGVEGLSTGAREESLETHPLVLEKEVNLTL